MIAAALLMVGGAASGRSLTQAESASVDQLVRELATFPAALPATVRSDGRPDLVEERRRAVYGRLRDMGQDALPALARGLADPDVRIRRNVALFLNAAGGGWWSRSEPKLDIQSCLPALIAALSDSDPRVRHLAAQAIGTVGPAAASAVPALTTLLSDADEGSRNSACIGLAGVGPAARGALPALRRALTDASSDVRRFAQRAIDRIEQ